MKKYEYKCICIIGGGVKITEKLNELGKEGWELVSNCWIWHYFKRELL